MDALTVTERRNKIIEMLNENGKINVNDLSALFSVSKVVIRTDLTELEHQGMLTRVHGGAITSYKSYNNMSLVQRSNTNAREKMAIAKKIDELIKDNSTIMMNAGTTPIFILRKIADKKVTIVTNSIALALEGAKNPNFKIVLLGGEVDSTYQFTYGSHTLKSLGNYSADVLILAVDGIDSENGISTYYHQEVEICREMINRSAHSIVAADYSKIGRLSFAKIDNVSGIDTLVTNKDSDEESLSKLNAKGIKIIRA